VRKFRATLLSILFGLAAAAPTAAVELTVGDPAPAFALKGSDGASYTLEGLLAEHRGVVLAWFPKAFTPG
jgi:peroxiredoxin Q/BCP